MATVLRVDVPGEGSTWTVLGSDLLPLAPVEEFLEYLRLNEMSPNTVVSYARSLGLFWDFISVVANPADEIRTFALEFLSSLHSRVGETGAARGNRFSRKTIYHSQVALSTCYEFAFDNRRELAQVLHEPRRFR